MRSPTPHRGFVILYAVLLVSIVLTISMSLFNITYKQLLLSITTRDSQYAFAAADSALDCVKYWDQSYYLMRGGGVRSAETSPFGYYDDSGFQPGNTYNINCGGGSVNVTESNSPDVQTTSFQINYEDSVPNTCAEVMVIKSGLTLVTASGYSANCNSINSDRVVQRTRYTAY